MSSPCPNRLRMPCAIALGVFTGITIGLFAALEVDFPDRGFLLFWQLPLDDKLRYFDIEEKIVNLKHTSDALTRKNELDKLLMFLGANPIEKIDNAFKEKYDAGILEYLELSGVE